MPNALPATTRARLEQIRGMHSIIRDAAGEPRWCDWCGEIWPCHTGEVLAELDALRAAQAQAATVLAELERWVDTGHHEKLLDAVKSWRAAREE